MKSLLVLTLVSACLVACSTSTDKTAPQTTTIKEGHAEVTPRPAAGQEIETDTFVEIKFDECSIVISRFVADDEEGLLDKTWQDSVFIWGALAESIEEQTIKFNGYEKLEDLKVEQRFVTSMYISDEGECCELRNWKHFISPWKSLQPIEPGLFRCINYTRKEHERFPPFTADEMKNAVRQHCGEGWLDIIRQVKKPTDRPSDVGISNYFIRISGKKGGTAFIKHIEIGSPLCA